MGSKKAFLGVGWRFPVGVDERTGRIALSSGEDDIKESIGIILSTRKGERAMLPEFGCDIFRYIYGALGSNEIAEMRRCVKEALRKWETRIINVEVNIRRGIKDGELLLDISYVVRATNTPYNLVYPYFITEGA